MDVDSFGVLAQQLNETKDDFEVAALTSHDDSMLVDYFDDYNNSPQENSSLNKSIFISNDSQPSNDFFSVTNDFNLPPIGETDYSLIEDEAVIESNSVIENCDHDLTWQNDSIFKALSYSDIEHQNLTQSRLNKSEKTEISRKRRKSQSISQVSVRLSNPRNESFLLSSDLEFEDNWSQEIQLNKSLKAENEIEICNYPETNDSKSFYGLPENVKTLIFRIKKIDSLYEWQNHCLSLPSIKSRKNLIYSLPTSGGKTLVAEILMLKEIICFKKNAIFILPFISIVQEKIQAMAPYAVEFDFLLEEYAAVKGQYPPIKRRKKNSIYICTIEKALGLINSLIETNRLNEIGMVVVDELHLLGEDNGRGAVLEVLLTKLMYSKKNLHIIGMSATIGNLEEVAKFLKADTYVGNFRPVELKEYVKCEDQIWSIDVREENIFQDGKKVKYPYSPKFLVLDPDKIGGLVMDVVPNDSCLIFCATKKNCESLAELLTRVLFNNLKTHKVPEKQLLLDALKAETKLCPILAATIEYGVAYHHSGLTSEERRLIEDAFREGVLCVICATSTLAAGVNLPAKRVILRKPYIGNQFMNLSRYKQMIGRAGRAGMGKFGESILICKANEMKKVQEMLTSKMDDCLSTLHEETDRGINYLILSSILLSLVNTREQIYQLFSFSLLGLQASRRNINLKEIIDSSIKKLIKSNALLIDNKTFSPNLKYEIPSQGLLSDVTMDSQLTLSTMVKAAMKACIDLKTAYILAEDLKLAQKQLILLNDLHLLYLITPYDFADKFRPDGSVLYDVITNLPETLMNVSRLLGISEITVAKLRDGIVPKNVPARVISRFYLTLILYELNQQRSIFFVAQKYNVDRGFIQNIASSATSFANSIIKFCQEIPEFWAFPNLFKEFNKKLTYATAGELEILMELPTVKAGRARQLHNAGYKTLQSIATANAKDLAEKIRYMPKSSISRIIASANLLLQEKIENLKDEYAEMMDGLDPNIPL